MANINELGREYKKGSGTSKDYRLAVVAAIKKAGGDENTGDIPYGVISSVGRQFLLVPNAVKNIWNSYIVLGTCSPQKGGTVKGQNTKLSDDDVEFIEITKQQNPTSTHEEVRDKLLEASPNPNANVSIMTISRTIKHRLPSGEWTRKKTTRIHANRFSQENLDYTQEYLNVMLQQNPQKVKFLDEAGIELLSGSNRKYGYSKIGERCIDIVKHHAQPNKTINLMVGLEGSFCTVIDGPSNTEKYLEFFTQAITANTTQSNAEMLQVGDIVVADNVAFHHNEAEDILRDWLATYGIRLTFTPKNMPDFNPCENCFSKIKSVLKKPKFAQLMAQSVELAVYDAETEISCSDILGYYRNTKCFNL